MISRVRIVVNAKSGRTFDVDGVYNYANSVVLVVNSIYIELSTSFGVYNYSNSRYHSCKLQSTPASQAKVRLQL